VGQDFRKIEEGVHDVMSGLNDLRRIHLREYPECIGERFWTGSSRSGVIGRGEFDNKNWW